MALYIPHRIVLDLQWGLWAHSTPHFWSKARKPLLLKHGLFIVCVPHCGSVMLTSGSEWHSLLQYNHGIDSYASQIDSECHSESICEHKNHLTYHLFQQNASARGDTLAVPNTWIVLCKKRTDPEIDLYRQCTGINGRTDTHTLCLVSGRWEIWQIQELAKVWTKSITERNIAMWCNMA